MVCEKMLDDLSPSAKEIEAQIKEWTEAIEYIDDSILYLDAASMWHESPSVRQKLSELVSAFRVLRKRLLVLLSGESIEALQEQSMVGHIRTILEVMTTEEWKEKHGRDVNGQNVNDIFKYCISAFMASVGSFIVMTREAVENNYMTAIDAIYEIKDIFNDFGTVDGVEIDEIRDCNSAEWALKNASYDEEDEDEKIELDPLLTKMYNNYKQSGVLFDLEMFASLAEEDG